MNKLNFVCLKLVRWTGWILLPLVLAFLITGYAMSGRYGLSVITDEKTALTLHKLMHLPLGVLVLVHVVPSVYLALQRWGWIKQRQSAG
jgi:Ni,Fe-hydrogenase I cytochrome b subunit